jgi:protein gp37
MGDKTAIEWTTATWNPVTGCDRVSEGCDHCYALTLAKRLKAMGNPRYQVDGDPRRSGPGFGVTLHEDQLDLPLRWRRQRTIFVNSMSDLFHEAVPDEFIERVFVVMARATHHTFQVLTKRPGRMASLLNKPGARNFIVNRAASENAKTYRGRGWVGAMPGHIPDWPLRNVWLGTSVETQKWADVRIPKLLQTPAAVRFLSCEPLLGDVNLTRWFRYRTDEPIHMYDGRNLIDWVICGGESGRGFRPMNLDHARSLRDECVAAGVPFFFKQVGGQTPKAGGRMLDGCTWDEMPRVEPMALNARSAVGVR